MRRGTSIETALVVLVIFGIVMILAAILYRQLLVVGEESYTRSQCQSSLLLTKSAQGAIDKASFWCVSPVENFVPLQCTREFRTVTDNQAMSHDEDVTARYDPQCPDGGNGCLAENVVAEEMKECWNLFFQGEAPVFQQVEADYDRWFSDNMYTRGCFVCSEVTLRTSEDVTGFKRYLKDKTLGLEQTYYTHLARNGKAICNPRVEEQHGTCWDAFGDEITWSSWWPESFSREGPWPGLDQDTLLHDETYAITFVRAGMEEACQQNDDGSDMPSMTVQAIPARNISSYCDLVMV